MGGVAVWLPVGALAAAALIQGALSRPAPPVFRWEIEGLIALLLALAVGWRQPLRIALGQVRDGPGWRAIGAVCLLILLWSPLLRGLYVGGAPADMLRDILPLLFLFLPLALVPALRPAGRIGAKLLTAALMLEGLGYCLRWWNHAGWGFGALGARVLPDGGGYLLNAPSVLFAAIAWPLAGLSLLLRGGWRGWLGAGLSGLAGAVCLAALLGTAHRMALGWVGLTALAALWTRGRRAPWLAPLLAVLMLGGLALEGDRLTGALFFVAEKTRQAGANARFEEAAAALTMAGDGAASTLLGGGWGALLENPAVGGWRVSYTHTMLTYIVVKAGMVGLAALSLWLGSLAPAALTLWRRDPAWTLALLAPLITAFTLHTSYKYLDTGVLLSLGLLAVSTFDDKELRQSP